MNQIKARDYSGTAVKSLGSFLCEKTPKSAEFLLHSMLNHIKGIPQSFISAKCQNIRQKNNSQPS